MGNTEESTNRMGTNTLEKDYIQTNTYDGQAGTSDKNK